MPTVTIDVSGSPLIADLARVHAVEGIGDVRSHALRENDSVLLGVSLTVPVQAMFVVVFSHSAHGQFLEEVAAAGMLLFATTDTRRAHEEKPLWLSVDIDGDALRQAVLSVGDESI
jgi:aromatic ring-cleaving dioxygenase